MTNKDKLLIFNRYRYPPIEESNLVSPKNFVVYKVAFPPPVAWGGGNRIKLLGKGIKGWRGRKEGEGRSEGEEK